MTTGTTRVWPWVALVGGAIGLIALTKVLTAPPAPVPVQGVRIVRTFPHDERAYCQGLLFHDGALYESTGKRGNSTVRRVALDTGRVERSRSLDARLFGEGLTLVGDRLVQLTWRAGKGFVYDRETLERQREFDYPGEGWGLAYDGEHLIMSDGTPTLRFLDPETFEERKRLVVRAGGKPLPQLNELEFIEGELWANVYRTDAIARIDPSDGTVLAWLQLAPIVERIRAKSRRAEVLNGIAYDPATKRIFITGKYWPEVYEISTLPPAR